jgi:hypothetical protein
MHREWRPEDLMASSTLVEDDWPLESVYGHFPLDLERHLDLDPGPTGLSGGPPLVADAIRE